MATYTEKDLALINAGLKAIPGRDYIQDNGSVWRGRTNGSLEFITDNFSVKAQAAVGKILTDSDSSTLTYDPETPSITPDLTDTGVVAGTYGDIGNIPQITIDEQGRVSQVINIPVASDFISSVTDTATIDLTVSLGALSANVNDDSITFAKTQNISTNKLLGRGTAGTGDIEEITLGTGLSYSGTTLNVSGFESPLTFSSGLTRTLNDVTNNLITGVIGGQVIIGGTAVGDGLQYKGTTANGTTTVAAHSFLVGNNGATNGIRIYNSGNVNIGNKANAITAGQLRLSDNSGTAWFDFARAGTRFGIWACGENAGGLSYCLLADSTETTLNGDTSVFLNVSANTIAELSSSAFMVKKSFVLPYTAKTATYSILTTDYTIDCTSGTFTVTLPTAVGVTGKVYVIKNSGAGVITLDTTSSQTIDGITSQTINSPNSIMVQSTGSNWIII